MAYRLYHKRHQACPDESRRCTNTPHLAQSFGLPMEQKVKTLSRGMRTRFPLALALSHHAQLIVMDEPTSGLDPVFRRRLLRIFRELLQDSTVSILFSTHITSDLERIADYITFVAEGRMVFSASRDDIFQAFAVVKGGKELLDGPEGELLRHASAFVPFHERAGQEPPRFHGIRIKAFGFEALTSTRHAAERVFTDRVVVERATLEDIMYYMGRQGDPPC